MSRRLALRLSSLALLVAIAGTIGSCGDSGGDDPPPLVEVLFPPGGSFTEGTAVTVRGRFAGTPLSAVTVNGIPAVSADLFLTWSAVVPLDVGVNELDVVATTSAGETDPSAPTIEITRGVQMGQPSAMAFDSVGNRLVLLDPSLVRLTLYDLGTGELTLLSGTGRGTGPAFDRLEDVAFDIANDRVLATDSDLNAVFAVDLATGNRTYVSGQGVGTGTALAEPRGLVLHAAASRILLVDSGIDAVVAVSLATGNRTILSDHVTGTGTDFSLPTKLVHDAGNDLVYVRDPSVGGLFTVALATGNRTVNADDGGGAFYDMFGGMALDLPNNRILATDGGFDTVFATDLTSFTQTIVSSESEGDGSPLTGPADLVHDPANGRVIVAQGGYPRLLSVALSDGDRTVLLDQAFGNGPRFAGPDTAGLELRRHRVLACDELYRVGFSSEIGAILDVDYRDADRNLFLDGGDFHRPTDLRVDLTRNFAYVYSSVQARIDRVDLDDGDGVLIADTSHGTGESLQFGSDLCYDPAGSRFLLGMGNPVNGILAVDEATGNRTIFANGSVGTGEPTFGITALECDATGSTVYYGTNSAGTIVKVDVATGVRTLVTQDPGVGPSAGAMQAMRLDLANNRLIVFAGITDSIVAVNLANGVRTELSGPNVGAGLPVASVGGGDVDLDRQIAVYADRTMQWLVAVDLTTGDRVAFSR